MTFAFHHHHAAMLLKYSGISFISGAPEIKLMPLYLSSMAA